MLQNLKKIKNEKESLQEVESKYNKRKVCSLFLECLQNSYP